MVWKNRADERAYVDVASRYLSRELQSGVPLRMPWSPTRSKPTPPQQDHRVSQAGFCRGYLDAARKYLLAYQEGTCHPKYRELGQLHDTGRGPYRGGYVAV